MSQLPRALSIGCSRGVLVLVVVIAFLAARTSSHIHRYIFNIAPTPLVRLCQGHDVITVNGQLPGPTIYVRNGDTVIVKTYNNAQYNATLHWHGVRQFRTGWADGPEYITQCPIQPGGSYTYKFTIIDQEGTLWWHAHFQWLRASVYGAIVIYPKKGSTYPFPKPSGEAVIQLGEWWNTDPMVIVNTANQTGAAPNISDAFTINGQPGDLYPYSSLDTFRLAVTFGETYLLRIVNAALNDDLFFKIANHEFIVVGIDASYTKPLTTDVIMISPGQTTDVLVVANKPIAQYYMAARAYSGSPIIPFDNTTTTAILEYKGSSPFQSPILPILPFYNDTPLSNLFTSSLRSLATPQYPIDVPLTIDQSLISTIGSGLRPCPAGQTCGGAFGERFIASMNNISFALPTISILQAYYFGINGVFTTDFPDNPPLQFDYTAPVIPRSLWNPVSATRVRVVTYNSTVQLVFQGTSIYSPESHPMHLHGYDFYVVGTGFGNYNPVLDPLEFNLIDPPRRNTVSVPVSGWAAIRFKADNPGAWFMHCHFDVHLTWGMNMVFLVTNGPTLLQTLEPPPQDLPRC